MAKKPSLKLVEPPTFTGLQPPENRGDHGASLCRSVMNEYDMGDITGREMLRQACAAVDRAEACAAHIQADGEVVDGPNGLKDHPALRHELANRAFVVWTLRNLGLDVEPVRPIGRPPQHRPNPPSELARKGQPVRPVLPEGGVRIRCYPKRSRRSISGA